MEDDKLTQRLEELSVPEIELPEHKKRLWQVLLAHYSRARKRVEIFSFWWRFSTALSLSLAILLLVVFNSSIFPRQDAALAKEIALQNPEVQSLIEQGGVIQDIKIVQGKAYLSLIKPLSQPVSRPEDGVAKVEKTESPVGFLPDKSQELFFGKPLKGTTAPATFTTFSVEVSFKEKRVTKVREIGF